MPMRDLADSKKTKQTTFTENIFVVSPRVQSSRIIANVAKEALMASHAVTDVQVIHFMARIHPPNGSHSCFCSCCLNCAVCGQWYLVDWLKKTRHPALPHKSDYFLNVDLALFVYFSEGQTLSKVLSPNLKTFELLQSAIHRVTRQNDFFDVRVFGSINTKDWPLPHLQ